MSLSTEAPYLHFDQANLVFWEGYICKCILSVCLFYFQVAQLPPPRYCTVQECYAFAGASDCQVYAPCFQHRQECGSWHTISSRVQLRSWRGQLNSMPSVKRVWLLLSACSNRM